MPTSSLALYRNGVLQKPGLDYNLSGNTIQFLAASTPQSGDTLLASYRVTPSGHAQGPPAPQILVFRYGRRSPLPRRFRHWALARSQPAHCSRVIGSRSDFDYSHEGSLTGFTFAVNWGNTLLVKRNGAVSDAFVSGWAEAGANTSACQLSFQSWGTLLGLANGVFNAYDSLAYPIVLALPGHRWRLLPPIR